MVSGREVARVQPPGGIPRSRGVKLLAKAAVDGSGRIELLADFAGRFTLSLDGNWMYFNNSMSFFNGIPDDVIYRVPLGGGGIMEEVLSNARYPRWYGN